MDEDVKRIRETAVRWSAAVTNVDIGTLRELMTDDIVVVHGNGRLVQGKEAGAADLVRGLAGVRIVQSVKSEETIVAGEWAFDLDGDGAVQARVESPCTLLPAHLRPHAQ